MRNPSFCLLGSLALTLAACGHSASQNSQDLDTILSKSRKALADLKSLTAVVERSTYDKALDKRDECAGTISLTMGGEGLAGLAGKPDKRSRCKALRLELTKKERPSEQEKYLCLGSTLYVFGNKSVSVIEMETLRGLIGPEILGTDAKQASAPYRLEHKGSDKHYHYVVVIPQKQQFISLFSEARVSIYRTNNLPAQIWYRQPSGVEVTWNFRKLQMNAEIPAKHFEPNIPAGWTVNRIKPARKTLAGEGPS